MTSGKRSAEKDGDEADDIACGDEQPGQGSLADTSMHEVMEVPRALGADVAELAQTYWPGRFHRRAGASGLSVDVTMDTLGMGTGLEAHKVTAQERLSVEKPSLLIVSNRLPDLFPVAGTRHEARQQGRAAEAWQALL